MGLNVAIEKLIIIVIIGVIIVIITVRILIIFVCGSFILHFAKFNSLRGSTKYVCI